MRAGRVNSGHASKFNRAGLFCARAQAHLRVRGSPNQFARYPLLCGQFRRSTWSRNWRVARVISAFTLCQYEHALSQINNGIRVLLRFVSSSQAWPRTSVGREVERPDGPGCLRVPGKTIRPTRSFLVGKRVAPPCCRGITLRRVALAPGGGADRSCSVWSTIHARAETFNDRARRLAAQDAMTTRAAPAAAPEAAFARPESFARPKSRVELSFRAGVLVAVKIEEEATMGRGLLLWLIGIPIPIILLIWLFGGLHG